MSSEEQLEIQSQSYVIDEVQKYIMADKEYRDIVHSFLGNPSGTFLFNVLGSQTLMEGFNQYTDEFPLMVKKAVLNLLDEWTTNKNLIKLAEKKLQVVITDATQIKMGVWDSEYEGIPVSTECQVIGASQEETYTKFVEAVCYKCSHREPLRDASKIPGCPNENCVLHKKEMEIDKTTIKTGAIRVIMIQEPLEEAKHGAPRILPCVIKDKQVAETFIGQHKKLIGVFRSHPQLGKNTNKIMIHSISMQDLDEHEEIQPTPELMAKFQQLSQDPKYLDILTQSFAPVVTQERLAKLCVILGIVGGTKVDSLRGNVHVLLVGDPAVAKSKILEFVLEVVKKAGMAVGGTMSGSGITVTLDTLPNRQKMVRAGVVSQCTGSCVVLDELNQVEPEDLGKLYEAMENGKIHYNKAGFDAVFDADTTILSGANPKRYLYDFDMGIVDNINLPAPLLSRFDLKLNMIQKKSMQEEREISSHIYMIRDIGVEQYIRQNNLLKPEEITLLLNHAKTFKPKMTKEAKDILEEFYLSLKQLEQPEKALLIDRRFHDMIIRVATAYAKLHLETEITKERAILAVEIIKATLKTFRMNTDRDMVTLPLDSQVDGRDGAFRHVFRIIQKEKGSDWISESEFVERVVREQSAFFPTYRKAQDYFDKLYENGDISKERGLFKLN